MDRRQGPTYREGACEQIRNGPAARAGGWTHLAMPRLIRETISFQKFTSDIPTSIPPSLGQKRKTKKIPKIKTPNVTRKDTKNELRRLRIKTDTNVASSAPK